MAPNATWPATNSRTCVGSSRSSSSGAARQQNGGERAAFSLSFVRFGITEILRCSSSAFDTIIITVRSASIGINWAKKPPAIAVAGVLMLVLLCALGGERPSPAAPVLERHIAIGPALIHGRCRQLLPP